MLSVWWTTVNSGDINATTGWSANQGPETTKNSRVGINVSESYANCVRPLG